MTNALPEHSPRDFGTSIASSIGMIFISFSIYSVIIDQRDQIADLEHSTWYEVELTPAQHLNVDAMQFRTGEMRLYINQSQESIYQQPCNGFKSVCKDLENKKIEIQSATFYSQNEQFIANSYLVLKAISFLDAEKNIQTLPITKVLPNDATYIAKQKHQFMSSFILMFFVFSMFTLVFYFNHLGRYLNEIKIVQHINQAIVFYYLATIAFVILHLILL